MNRPADTPTMDPRLAAPAAPKAARWLALGAVAGPILFALAWLVLGFLSPGYTLFGTHIAPYSPISQPISGLGLGRTGPYMNAAFVVSGLLLLAGVIGIFQTLEGPGRPAARWTWAGLLAYRRSGSRLTGSSPSRRSCPTPSASCWRRQPRS